MRIPKSLEALAHDGVIREVIRPLMSGKEAQIYLVVSEGRYCAAKIYKDAQNRSFKNRADYTEGRKVRNSRDQRAMAKGSKYGKGKDEDTWKATEVEMIYRLRAAGVRVPEPYMYIDGVLLMELVSDVEGNPAPRLGDLEFSPEEATDIYYRLIREAARMLAAGVVHGDLSDFNVLLAADGPVVIDFPQSISAAGNLNARSLFLRDVNNLHRFLERWVPGVRRRPYGEEMWELYEKNELSADTRLTGKTKARSGPVDTRAVLSLIGDANRDEAARRRALGKSTAGLDDDSASVPRRRREFIVEKPQPSRRESGRGEHGRPSRADPPRGGSPFGRNADTRRGRPPPRKDEKSGPKRGDGVQASTYVSPEARRTKVKALTPRDATAAPSSPGPNSERRRDRRPRRPRRRSSA